MKFETGTPFDPNVMATSLHPGQSTTADVQALLGPPYGTGSAMMPYHDRSRLAWTYFFDRGNIDIASGHIDERFGYLFVFFLGDHFDSYIWFDTM